MMAGRQTYRSSRLNQRRGSLVERRAEPPPQTINTRTPDASCIASSLLFLPLMGNSTLLSVPSDRERRVDLKNLNCIGCDAEVGEIVLCIAPGLGKAGFD